MKFFRYICHSFKHYADFKGRANRGEFWSFLVLNTIVTIILIAADNHLFPEGWHHGVLGLILESLNSGYSIPYLLNWYEQHPDISMGLGMVTSIWAMIVLVPNIALGVRRLHDINMNGWFIVVSYAPVIGWGWFFIYSLLRGSEEENNYGPVESYDDCRCCKK